MATYLFRISRAFAISAGIAVALTGCGDLGLQTIGTRLDANAPDPLSTPITDTGLALAQLPPAHRKIDVGVYRYEDKTGQNEPADNFSRFSRAVSQGMSDVLIDVLTEVGGRQWFNVIERANLQDLLTERQLIDQTNLSYRGQQTSALEPLRFAGILINGGVIDYDTNVMTGGFGARILGIGSNGEYRRDRISIVLRAVSVQTGDVLASVQTEKSVYSVSEQGSVFRFVAVDELLEIDAGYSVNEPTGIAVRQAVELGVYDLILEGAELGIWAFDDAAAQRELLTRQRTRLTQLGASSDAARMAAATRIGIDATPR